MSQCTKQRASTALLKNSSVTGEIHFRSQDGTMELNLCVEQQGNYLMEKYFVPFVAKAYVNGVDENDAYEEEFQSDTGETSDEDETDDFKEEVKMDEKTAVTQISYGVDRKLTPGTTIMNGKFRAMADDETNDSKDSKDSPFEIDDAQLYDEELMKKLDCCNMMTANLENIDNPEAIPVHSDTDEQEVAEAPEQEVAEPPEQEVAEPPSDAEAVWFTVKEAANYWGLGVNKMYALTKLPDFPCEKQGRKIMISQVKLDSWKESHPNFAELARQLRHTDQQVETEE